jgi:hypothetical protein
MPTCIINNMYMCSIHVNPSNYFNTTICVVNTFNSFITIIEEGGEEGCEPAARGERARLRGVGGTWEFGKMGTWENGNLGMWGPGNLGMIRTEKHRNRVVAV